MTELIAHRGASNDPRRAVAGDGWAVVVRPMVGRHDEGGQVARAMADRFVTELASLPVSAKLDEHRRQLSERVRSSVTEGGGYDDDSLLFTLIVAVGDGLRVFNIGPQRTVLIRPDETTTIVAPHSLAEQLRQAGAAPAPEHALISTRGGSAACQPEDIDAHAVTLSRGDWIVTIVDDRIAPPTFAAMPSSEALLAQLGERAAAVPNPIDDWLLASSG